MSRTSTFAGDQGSVSSMFATTLLARRSWSRRCSGQLFHFRVCPPHRTKTATTPIAAHKNLLPTHRRSQKSRELGRILCVARTLECERPFLEPLCNSFVLIHALQLDGYWYVAFILRNLATEVARCRRYPCGDFLSNEVASKVDAQASSERTGIGSWFSVVSSDGRIDPCSLVFDGGCEARVAMAIKPPLLYRRLKA